jgi:hypothetical protein
MSKIRRRLTIIPSAVLRGWRRLDYNVYSGQLKTKGKGKAWKIDKFVQIKFDFVTHYPRLNGSWEEHFLGEKDGVFIIMYMSDQSRTQGPEI